MLAALVLYSGGDFRVVANIDIIWKFVKNGVKVQVRIIECIPTCGLVMCGLRTVLTA